MTDPWSQPCASKWNNLLPFDLPVNKDTHNECIEDGDYSDFGGCGGTVRIPAKMITGHNNGMIAPTTALMDSLNGRRFPKGFTSDRLDKDKNHDTRHQYHCRNETAHKKGSYGHPVIPPEPPQDGGRDEHAIAEAAETMDTVSSDL